jgi:hypothetical protein
MSEHIVKSFDQELQHLDKKVAQMGGYAEQLLAHAFAGDRAAYGLDGNGAIEISELYRITSVPW